MSQIRYLCGTLEVSSQRRQLIVDDGRLTHGFLVTGFTLWPTNGNDVGDMDCVLSTMESGAVRPMYGEDTRQVGWGYCSLASQAAPMTTILRPTEIILEELFIVATWYDGFDNGLNYLIELTPITISDSHSALVLINNKSQDLS